MENYFNPEIETMPVDEIKKLQSERLVEQVKYVYDNVEFYRNKMDEMGVKPEDIKWNFTKFLIDKEGNVVKRYSPTFKPEDMEKDVLELL